MSKPSLTLRKPRTKPAQPAEIQAFIEGCESEQIATTVPSSPERIPPNAIPLRSVSPEAIDIPSFRRANKSIAHRKTKPHRRRTTVYMELDIAKELAKHCVEHDEDMSDAVNKALRAWLPSL